MGKNKKRGGGGTPTKAIRDVDEEAFASVEEEVKVEAQQADTEATIISTGQQQVSEHPCSK